MKIPVLFIIFNRPEFTQKVFDKIKEYKPERLFIVADGPRKYKDSDIISGYGKALPKAYDELKQKHGESTMLGIGIRSGGSKGIANTAAITMMPGILTDSDDKPIPIPVTRSLISCSLPIEDVTNTDSMEYSNLFDIILLQF